MAITLESIRLQGKLKVYREAYAAAVQVHLDVPTPDTLEALQAARKQLDATEDEVKASNQLKSAER